MSRTHLFIPPVALVALVTLGASCASRFAVPPDAVLLCSSSDDCLGGTICLTGAGVCVDADGECVIGGTADPAIDGTACGTEPQYCLAGRCVDPSCGDGFISAEEPCDDGDANALLPDRCRPGCVLPTCGDGVVDSGESCDDIDPTCSACVRVCPEERADCDGDAGDGCDCGAPTVVVAVDESIQVSSIRARGDDLAWSERTFSPATSKIVFRTGGESIDIDDTGVRDFDVGGGRVFLQRDDGVDAVSIDGSEERVFDSADVIAAFDVDERGVCIARDDNVVCELDGDAPRAVISLFAGTFEEIIVCGDRVAAFETGGTLLVAERDGSTIDDVHEEQVLSIVGMHMQCDGDVVTWVDDGMVAHELAPGAEVSTVVGFLSPALGVSGVSEYAVSNGHYFITPSVVVEGGAVFHLSRGSVPYRMWDRPASAVSLSGDGRALLFNGAQDIVRYELDVPPRAE